VYIVSVYILRYGRKPGSALEVLAFQIKTPLILVLRKLVQSLANDVGAEIRVSHTSFIPDLVSRI